MVLYFQILSVYEISFNVFLHVYMCMLNFQIIKILTIAGLTCLKSHKNNNNY